MMKVLITGANGMVARAAIAYCRSLGDEIFTYTRQEMDISDSAVVKNIFSDTLPEAVINCAAYTDVDGSETHTELCYAANALGVENLAAAAKNIAATFVTISTDYVFDGKNPGFYTEQDETGPLGVYGKAKLEGEIRAREVDPDCIIVRSGWIYGRGGTNFLSKAHLLLAEGKTIKAISDSYGTPTFADDLAVRLRELAELKQPGLYHVTNAGDGASYAGFARNAAEINGYDMNLIEDISVDSLQRPAPRPRSSKLVTLNTKLAPLPDWKKALETFLTGSADGSSAV
jgi:dTDP-4-dehydrorhamnose reductase